VLPIMDYEFEGIPSTDTDYELLRDPFADSLSPKLPMGLNLGHQLHWQQKHLPEAFSRATALLLYPQYWAWRLCGVMASELTSSACMEGARLNSAGRSSTHRTAG